LLYNNINTIFMQVMPGHNHDIFFLRMHTEFNLMNEFIFYPHTLLCN